MKRGRRFALAAGAVVLAGCGLNFVGIDLESTPDAGVDAGVATTPDVVTAPDVFVQSADDDGGVYVLFTHGSGNDAVRAVAVDNAQLFVAGGGQILSLQVDGGGTPAVVVDNAIPLQLAVKGNDLWFSDGDSFVHHHAIDTGTDTKTNIFAGGCVTIDPDGTKVWATHGLPDPYFATFPISGGADPSGIVDGGLAGNLWGVTPAANGIYFSINAQQVALLNVATSTATVIADNELNPQCITLDGNGHIYWPTYDDLGHAGSINRADLNGQHLIVVVTGLLHPTQIAMDAEYMYWNSDNQVLRMHRPAN